MMVKPTQRVCVHCGRDFLGWTNQKVCIDCRAEYRKAKRDEWISQHPGYYRDYNQHYNRTTHPKKTVTQPQRKQPMKPKPKPKQTPTEQPNKLAALPTKIIDVGGQQYTMTKCYKFEIHAITLPCGKNDNCYHEPRCPYIPDDVEQKYERTFNVHPNEKRKGRYHARKDIV